MGVVAGASAAGFTAGLGAGLGLGFGASRRGVGAAAGRQPAPPAPGDDATRPITDQLDAYFAGELRDFDVPLDLRAVHGFVRTALEDAGSVAGLLITTEAMIADAPKKESGAPAGGGMPDMGGMGMM